MVIQPDSSGVRSASRMRAPNSGASSRNNTPRWAREMDPGRTNRTPPPIIEAGEDEWCGSAYGGSISKPPLRSIPASECRAETSTASSPSREGRMLVSRAASMVFPTPGAPCRNTWCLPAAATSMTQRPSRCPRTSRKSSGVRCPGFVSSSTGDSQPPNGGSPFSTATRSLKWPTAHTVTPGTSEASASWLAGTITLSNPLRTAANTAGRIPGTLRNLPSSPSSPRHT